MFNVSLSNSLFLNPAGSSTWTAYWLCAIRKKHPLHTNQWLPSPVVLVVKDVSVSVKEVREELPQIVVVGLLEEVEPPHIPQVGGHLFCSVDTGTRIHRFKHRDVQTI